VAERIAAVFPETQITCPRLTRRRRSLARSRRPRSRLDRLQRRKSVESVLVSTGRPSNPFESSVHFLVEGLDDAAFSTDDVYAHLSAMHQRFRRR
jgi:hypothetical protein